MLKFFFIFLVFFIFVLLFVGCGQVVLIIVCFVVMQVVIVVMVSIKLGDMFVVVEVMIGGKVLLWNVEGCDDYCIVVVSLIQLKLMVQGFNVGCYIFVEVNYN